jgi:hypothetical protein
MTFATTIAMIMIQLFTLTASLFTRGFLTQGSLVRLRCHRSSEKQDYIDKLGKSVLLSFRRAAFQRNLMGQPHEPRQMLTAQEMAFILAHAGIQVPPCPIFKLDGTINPTHRNQLDHLLKSECALELVQAVREWNYEVASLYAAYMAARAAKTLRDAESARQMTLLRLANARL